MYTSDGAVSNAVASVKKDLCESFRLEPWEHADLAIDAMLGADQDVWAARPVIASKRRRRLEDRECVQFRPGTEVPREDFARAPRAPKRLKFGLKVNESGAVALWTTSNQRRALFDYAHQEMSSFPVKEYLGERELATLVERSHETCLSAYATSGQSFEGEFLIVRQQVIVAATVRVLLTRILDYCNGTSIVVATQHATLPRAGIVAARRLGIPSIYIPHAPFASNRLYADLPADWAGLWGHAEREIYVSMGADPSRVSVVGTAMHHLVPSTGRVRLPEKGTRPLVAPSAWQDDRLAFFLQACAAALPGNFSIAPHPRNNLDVIHEFASKRITVLQGVSASHFESAQALIQCYSGIALEGLLAGVSVINFNPFGVRSNYPLIREPYVSQCKTADELRRALERQATCPEGALSSGSLDWARLWCDCSGPEAEERLRALVRFAEPQQQPVLDGWMIDDA